MLLPATIFEGYDITIFHLCTPDIAASFHLTDARVGMIATLVRTGGILSFLVVTLADRFGRKPMLGVTVVAYAACTLLTGLSRGAISFTLFQSIAQIFLAAEFGIAITMISEEFPDEQRGRAVSILLMAAFIGVATAGMLYGPIAMSRWGWRGMYFLGIAPLVLIALIRRKMRETARFRTAVLARGTQTASIAASISKAFEPLRGPWRKRLITVAILCNCVGLVGGPVISFFSLYARREHGWSPEQVGTAFVLAYLAGSCGTLLSGDWLDRIGRRISAIIFFVVAAASAMMLFQSSGRWPIFFAIIATMFAYQGARTATSALGVELFPTHARASGFCLTVQVLGQFGWVLAPLGVGLLSVPMNSLGNAAAVFATGPIIGAVVVALFIPETRGKTLEELSPEYATSTAD